MRIDVFFESASLRWWLTLIVRLEFTTHPLELFQRVITFQRSRVTEENLRQARYAGEHAFVERGQGSDNKKRNNSNTR